MLYFALGIYISSNKNIIEGGFKERKYIYLFLAVMLLVAVSKVFKSYFHLNITPLYARVINTFLVPLLFIFFYILLYRLSTLLVEGTNLLKKMMTVIGRYSFGIYMIHLLVMFAIDPVLHGMNEAFVWEFFLLFYISTILLSIVFLKLISLLPYSEFIVGGNIRQKR